MMEYNAPDLKLDASNLRGHPDLKRVCITVPLMLIRRIVVFTSFWQTKINICQQESAGESIEESLYTK